MSAIRDGDVEDALAAYGITAICLFLGHGSYALIILDGTEIQDTMLIQNSTSLSNVQIIIPIALEELVWTDATAFEAWTQAHNAVLSDVRHHDHIATIVNWQDGYQYQGIRRVMLPESEWDTP